MKIFDRKIKKNKGYAILFSVVVIGIISMITIGLSNAAYKQMILSSVAKDSMTAFYQADMAAECALFFDNEEDILNRTDLSTFNCAGNNLTFKKDFPSIGSYAIVPLSETSIDKCFRIDIIKTITPSLVSTEINAMGYNICNKSNFRTVERSLKITY